MGKGWKQGQHIPEYRKSENFQGTKFSWILTFHTVKYLQMAV